jgi:hypothetical protein
MGTSGYVQTPGRTIHREVIPAPFAADSEPFDYVVSRISGIGVRCEHQAAGQYQFFHAITVSFFVETIWPLFLHAAEFRAADFHDLACRRSKTLLKVKVQLIILINGYEKLHHASKVNQPFK